MRNILFIIPDLSHGGTNKCLENILPYISKSYKISILSLTKDGVYKERFIPYNLYFLNNRFYNLTRNILFRIANRLSGNYLRNILYKSYVPIIEDSIHPDLVIAFQEGISTLFTSFFKQKKIAWIHCDYKLYKEIVTNKDELKIYQQFNKIICVSKYTRTSFCNYYPSLFTLTDYIYNALDYNKIHNLSLQNNIDSLFIKDLNTFVIISIGRFAEVKQFDKIPQIVSLLKTKNPSKIFKWYIIGDGSKKQTIMIKDAIIKYNTEKEVILLGVKDNPYPYIINSDLLVSLSRSEACPYVINEGKILKIPVLSTDYPSAIELIDNGKTGIIRNIKYFPEALYHLIENTDNIYNNIKEFLINDKYNNNDIISKIKNLFNCILNNY